MGIEITFNTCIIVKCIVHLSLLEIAIVAEYVFVWDDYPPPSPPFRSDC